MTNIVYQTDEAKGLIMTPYGKEAGNVFAKRATFTFTVAASADLLELIPIPAGCHLVDAKIDTTGTITLGNAGVMNGDVGDPTYANRSVAANAITSGALDANGRSVARSDKDRSFGAVVTSAQVGATVSLLLLYAA